MKFLLFLIKIGLTNQHLNIHLSSLLLSCVFLFTALAIVVALAKQNKVIVTYSYNFSSNKNKAFLRKKRVHPSANSSFSSFYLYKTKDNKNFYETHTETMYHSMSGTLSKEDDIVTTIINFSIDHLSAIGYNDGLYNRYKFQYFRC
jgi:hypothetical protein